KSLGQVPSKSFHFFDDGKEMDSIYSPFHEKNQGPYFGLCRRKNIIVIVLESFSAEHVGFLDKTLKTSSKSFTPFLDELSKHSLCLNGWANGSISIEALPSIFSSIPSLQEKPYVRTSSGISNHIEGLTSQLETIGYHASFFYGGKKHSCDFDCYWKKVGLKHYFCEDNFPKITKEIYSGWGIHDLPFLNHVADALNQQPEPFVSGIFTLSAHHPFITPKGFETKFPKGKHPIQELVAYTDYALKCFWEKISQMPWYKNTLFVLVADHTSGAIEPYYQGPIGAFSIPIFFFDPEDRLPRTYAHKMLQQIDIMPTLLHLVGYGHPYVAFGQNLMDEKRKHFAVNLKDNIYQLITDDYVLQFDGEATIGFFDRRRDLEARKNLLGDPVYEISKQKYEKFLKAFLQQYSRALAQDALTPENWTEMKNSASSRFTI
ncbi:MAG: sulfatase-like hydrolase/transferase, partial [Puniceicoccales bacterium]|nr:sulfatase-like hydrolase/transferase [Puniceicoccales bacterium]